MSTEEYKRKCKQLQEDLDGAMAGVLGASIVIAICAVIALIVDKLQ